jgi:hypothetical protein
LLQAKLPGLLQQAVNFTKFILVEIQQSGYLSFYNVQFDIRSLLDETKLFLKFQNLFDLISIQTHLGQQSRIQRPRGNRNLETDIPAEDGGRGQLQGHNDDDQAFHMTLLIHNLRVGRRDGGNGSLF